VLVNAPLILRIILEAVKPFVDDRTMSKVLISLLHLKPIFWLAELGPMLAFSVTKSVHHSQIGNPPSANAQ
jgi:hypothetical protein